MKDDGGDDDRNVSRNLNLKVDFRGLLKVNKHNVNRNDHTCA